ncbi:MAG TPA: FAD:protein FMN transferase [Gaiella sp.]|nr:FAD:protein FMN transferase [Gaiella sp.]
MLRHAFRAMGTEVELLLDVQRDAAAWDVLRRGEAEVERLEQLLSRFREDSELSELNRRGALRCGPDVVRVVELAVRARERTGGLFDPTVHDAVVAAGYDRSFELLRNVAGDGLPRRCGGDVVVDGEVVSLGEGVRLDLGGIAKGYTADRVAEMLATAGPCLVNVGGDLTVRSGRWPVAVTDDLTLELTAGALATTGRDRRRWRRAGVEAHHVIDPATGLPAATDVVRATVFADTAADAEALATAAFLGAELDVPRVLVLADGRTIVAGALA